MSSKLFVVLAAVSLVASVGCQGVFIPKAQYDRDIEQLKAYNEGLERDNADMHAKLRAYEAKGDPALAEEQARAYQEMADALKKALAGLGVDPGDVRINPATGAWEFLTDLLFDSGSFDISTKGKEVLKKFAEAARGKELKIVGHTDRRPVVQAGTKAKLYFDSNWELSTQRAVAVLMELSKNGISPNHMWVEGRAATQLKGTDKTSRRVEIYITGTTGKVSKP